MPFASNTRILEERLPVQHSDCRIQLKKKSSFKKRQHITFIKDSLLYPLHLMHMRLFALFISVTNNEIMEQTEFAIWFRLSFSHSFFIPICTLQQHIVRIRTPREQALKSRWLAFQQDVVGFRRQTEGALVAGTEIRSAHSSFPSNPSTLFGPRGGDSRKRRY